MTVTVSMPVRHCSKGILLFFRMSSITAVKPDSSLTISFSTWMTDMPTRPATPMIGCFVSPLGSLRTMVVPASAGESVFRMLMGMFMPATGMTASVCSTDAPM